ncbi:MAG: DUF4956 domain-containing protein [Oscillospiraceae bacterium]|nr:DUF4956 domain-containing protein [Oscillospiraceae bacterium]
MSSIFNSILTGSFSVGQVLLCLLFAGLCGGVAALALRRESNATRSFLISLAVLPIIVATVILMVNGSVGTGIAVAGAFSLVRFRSAAGRARDITAIFLVMAAGLACAAGYVAFALLFTLIVSGLIRLLSRIPMSCERFAQLHIAVPESLHFADAFDDLFEQYTKSRKLVKAKTSNMGSLYKLDYKIEMKDPDKLQEFLDALRCRNGNLEIAVLNEPEGGEEL